MIEVWQHRFVLPADPGGVEYDAGQIDGLMAARFKKRCAEAVYVHTSERRAVKRVSRRLFTGGLRPLDHIDMPAVDALKQQNRGQPVVEPGQLPGELHARPATTTDQPRL